MDNEVAKEVIHEDHASHDTMEFRSVMEKKIEGIGEWLTEELGREQQHLMLMQNQIDKQNQEIISLRKIIEQEKAQRTLAQRATRESKEILTEQAQTLADSLEIIELRLRAIEIPWWKKFLNCIPKAHELTNTKYTRIK